MEVAVVDLGVNDNMIRVYSHIGIYLEPGGNDVLGYDIAPEFQ